MTGITARLTGTASLGVGVFLLTFGVCAFSLVRNRQMGVQDRWFYHGVNLAANGVLGQDLEPSVFKPPGYPAFIAAVVRATVGAPVAASEEPVFARTHELTTLSAPFDRAFLERAARAVYWSQALALAAAAVLLFYWMLAFCRPEIAFAAAFVFGTNAYCVLLVGLLQYAVLHMFLLIAAGMTLERAALRRHTVLLLTSGILWGAATLVRPVTLLLPPFLLCALLLKARPDYRRSLRQAALVLLGMILVLAPYTVRNHRLAGQLVPVSAQTWTSLWAASTAVVETQPNHYRWKVIGIPLRRIVRRTFPELSKPKPPNPDSLSLAQNLQLEDTMKDLALKNLRQRPQVYVENSLRSFYSFNVHINAVLIKVYQFVQRPHFRPKAWYMPGHPQDFYPPSATSAFTWLIGLLTLLSIVGAVWALRTGDSALALSGAVYLCLAVGHSITWMDLWYYYVKMPFLCLFGFYAVDRIQRWSESRGSRWPWGRLLAGGIVAYSAILTVRVLWSS